jgi:hypothetical protein
MLDRADREHGRAMSLPHRGTGGASYPRPAAPVSRVRPPGFRDLPGQLRGFIALVAALVLAGRAAAQVSRDSERWLPRDGLSLVTGTAILQDRVGFLWG